MTKLLIAILVLLFMGIPFANAEQVYYCDVKGNAGLDIKNNQRAVFHDGSLV